MKLFGLIILAVIAVTLVIAVIIQTLRELQAGSTKRQRNGADSFTPIGGSDSSPSPPGQGHQAADPGTHDPGSSGHGGHSCGGHGCGGHGH